jgi:short-chain fatty acids transporter
MKLKAAAKKTIPDPLVLAILLSLITMTLAWLYGPNTNKGVKGIVDVFSFWEQGFWDLLAFSMQMVLILLLGYMLALTPLLNRLSDRLAMLTTKPAMMVLFVAISALVFGFLNWGLALVFGAVFVKKLGDAAQRQKLAIPYPLMGATAYVCMMVWHGGLSGSAPLSVAEASHFLVEQTGTISINETVFSKMNLWAWGLLAVFIPPTAILMLKKASLSAPDAGMMNSSIGSQSIDDKNTGGKIGILSIFGLIMLAAIVANRINIGNGATFGLNDINLILLALVFVFAGSVKRFATDCFASHCQCNWHSHTVSAICRYYGYCKILRLTACFYTLVFGCGKFAYIPRAYYV